MSQYAEAGGAGGAGPGDGEAAGEENREHSGRSGPARPDGGRSGRPGKRARRDEELCEILDEAWPHEQRVRSVAALSGRAVAGEFRALALLLAYAYGKPGTKKYEGEDSSSSGSD